jgi:FixJ family two-component response regulator
VWCDFVQARIHIIDDEMSILVAIRRLLRAVGYDVEIYQSAEQFLQGVPDDTIPGCILLDVWMPGMNGFELQTRLAELGSILPIIFLTGAVDIPTAVQTVKAGAQDFLTKPVLKDKLIDAIEHAVTQFETSRQRIDHLNWLRGLVSKLTPRERQVFELLARGKANKEIGRELGAAERTIKAHRHKVMEKMRSRSIAEVALIASRLGIVSLSGMVETTR